MLASDLVNVRLLIPRDRYDLVGLAYEQGTVAEKRETPAGIRLSAAVPRPLAEKLAPYTVLE